MFPMMNGNDSALLDSVHTEHEACVCAMLHRIRFNKFDNNVATFSVLCIHHLPLERGCYCLGDMNTYTLNNALWIHRDATRKVDDSGEIGSRDYNIIAAYGRLSRDGA